MDFENLVADKTIWLTRHFTKGRSGQTVQYLVYHYNDGDLTTEGCYGVWQTREASAHYQVESDGTIGQLVRDADTAWHAGKWDANTKSIGIECANQGDSITDAAIESWAHLVAALCKAKGLGRPQDGVNLFPHCHFSSTSCPGPLKAGTSYHARAFARAGEWYDAMTGGTDAGEPSAPDAGASAGGDGGDKSLNLDGEFGYYTVLALQEFLRSVGTYGSGLSLDGEAGHYTVLALQEYLRQTGDYGSGLALDGVNGGYTAQALQEFLRREGYYGDGLTIDQTWGYYTTLALQEFLRAKGFYN